ncbi:MAG: phosphotransferase [Pseudomonadota bacterium]|nr:phosphotransferase [Pseudomonadota bacterium]
MDNRLPLLTDWVRRHPGFEHATPEPVSGDASFRRYFRVFDNKAQPFIVMDAPPEHEDCGPFLAIARHWHEAGIAVPQIHDDNLELGFLLLEDLGDALMLPALNNETADAYYQGALDELARIAALPAPADYPLPAYDTALLDREMALFPDWLLEKHLGMTLDNGARSLLETTFRRLRESALAQPVVTVHRDYHSRNLLIREGQSAPGVIDFQDAVRGPVTYDAVSLLKDCYIRWPQARVAQWLEYYRLTSHAAGLHNADRDTFTQWFELMGIQRHLKAAGIFARLALRDGKTGYLADIPRTVSYIRDATARQCAFRAFHEWLCDEVIPVIEANIGPVPLSKAEPA